jgi:hypothetical protein
MEKELLEMAASWKKTSLEEPRDEFANKMLLACAEML